MQSVRESSGIEGVAAAFLGGIVAALLLSCSLVALGLVPLKMLPFDNKNEFLVLVDMPEGTTLEDTDRVASDFESYLATVNEVRDIESFVGIASYIFLLRIFFVV